MVSRELALTGLRVLDLTQEVAGPYCTMLLAGLGADVVKVEPPAGESGRRVAPFVGDREGVERSLRFLHLNRAKRSVLLDPDVDADRSALRALAADVDAMILDAAPAQALAPWAVTVDELRAVQPRLVVISLPPFASGGVWADWAASELTLCAASGSASCTGEPDGEPLKTGGYLSLVAQGQTALAATLAALLAARRRGVGSDVEVAGSEANAEMMGLWTGGRQQRMPRLGRGHQVSYPWQCYRALDGWVGVQSGPSAWPEFCDLIDAPDLAKFEPLELRIQARDEIDAAVNRWLSARGKIDAYHAGQAARFGFGYVADAEDIARSPQLAARGFFRAIPHPSAPTAAYAGPPFVLASGWRDARAPLLGEHTAEVLEQLSQPRERAATSAGGHAGAGEQSAPLGGVRVLDLTQIWAGPRATMTLADYGADVIKIESRDRVRRPAASETASERELHRRSGQENLHRGKRHITLDLRSELGRRAFNELVGASDVVIANFAAGVLPRLGASYEELHALNPRIVLVSMTGFGETGPERGYVAYGVAQEQLCGIYGTTGYEGEEPLKSGFNIGDPMNGMHAVAAVLAALIERERTGEGQYIDFSQFESSIPFIGEVLLDYEVNQRVTEPAGNSDPTYAPHGIYPAQGDEQWIAITARDEAEWQAALAVLGAPELAGETRFATLEQRRAHHRELDRELAARTRQRTRDALATALQAAGVPAAPVLHTDEVWAHPQYIASEFVQRMTHSDGGEYVYTGPMWRIDGARPRLRAAAPLLGEHNEEVLGAMTSLTAEEIRTLAGPADRG